MTIDPLDLIEQRLVERVAKVKRRGDKIEACCPSHDDRSPSLGVARGTTRDIVIKCQAGCSADDVLAALDLTWTDFGEPRADVDTIEYPYHTAAGETAYVVVRFPGKQFKQKHRGPTGEWVWNMRGVDRLLYRLPAVIDAVANGKRVIIVEGEKDADRLAARGVVATCNSGGADEGNGSKFTTAMADVLAGATVLIIADKDKAGYAHAAHVRRLLVERGCTVTVTEPLIGKDISNHLDAGKTSADLVTIDPDERLQEWVEPDEPVGHQWGTPKPIGGGLDALPSFPVEVFPEWIASHVQQVADELQVPIDLPASLAVVALATVAAKRAEVWLTGTWREQLCLYLVVALPPGAGKSPAFTQMMGPLSDLETRLRTEALARIAEATTRKAIIEKQYRKAVEQGSVAEALTLQDELTRTIIDPEPRLFVDDVTVEKLGEMLRDQQGRLALTSTEGGLFDQMAGRYSDKMKASLDPYLQMWSGDTVRVDRIGRGSIVVDKPALTIGITVQPSVLESLRDRPELKGRGVTARFMYSVPPSNVGYRNRLRDVELDPQTSDNYTRHIEKLWGALDHPGTIRRLRLTEEARQAFIAWTQQIEDARRPGGNLVSLTEWSTKAESSVIRLAGLLHLAHGYDDTTPIELITVTDALAVGEYWIAHARSVHEMWGADETTNMAQKILAWVVDGGHTTFTLRDCYRAVRAQIAEDVVEPLGLLVDGGWVYPQAEGPIVVGKRGTPSPTFDVHPAILSHVRNIHVTMSRLSLETKKATSLSLSLSSQTSDPRDKRDMVTRPTEAHEPVEATDGAPVDNSGPIDDPPDIF